GADPSIGVSRSWELTEYEAKHASPLHSAVQDERIELVQLMLTQTETIFVKSSRLFRRYASRAQYTPIDIRSLSVEHCSIVLRLFFKSKDCSSSTLSGVVISMCFAFLRAI
ncbi:hypothetical protein U4I94_22590, partial [Stenotrophomonas maltophilia]|uniref:hypothetical protein n=1 Tax=Stenotrophomonas maltophilia TaxID=40324 RepID=UPI002ACCE595